MKSNQKLKIGDRVILPKKEGVTTYERNATVVGEYDAFYLVLTSAGYRECVTKESDEYRRA